MVDRCLGTALPGCTRRRDRSPRAPRGDEQPRPPAHSLRRGSRRAVDHVREVAAVRAGTARDDREDEHGTSRGTVLRDLASTLSLRVPDAYVSLHDERDGSFLLLLEDLVTTGGAVSDGTWGIAPDAAAVALDELAELHVRFEDPARREAEAPWVPRASHGSNYGATMLRYGLDHHRDRLSDDFAAVAEMYIDHSDVLHALWQAGPSTVIHGDPHIGNLFDDHGRAGFLDWGIINVSTPMRDVSYFLNMAMSIEDRQRHDRDLLRHYLDRRAAAGGSEITFDDAWHAHRIHAAYTVPASCQVVMFPDNATPRRRVFAAAFLARAEAALADLEVRSVLRQTAGL